MQSTEPPTIGWREWVSLPAFGIAAIKAKLDTGARTSSLSVVSLDTFDHDGQLHVRFAIRPRRRGGRLVMGEAPVVDRRPVTDSGGHTTERWFIRTEVVLGAHRFDADINLTDRRAMLFPLLLGRAALCERFRIDSALSYSCAKPLPLPSTP